MRHRVVATVEARRPACRAAPSSLRLARGCKVRVDRRHQQRGGRSHGVRRPHAGQAAVRLHDLLPHHLSRPSRSGIASYLAVLEGLWLVTGRNVFLAVFNYWKKIFAAQLRHGRRVGHRHELPVRHQLERVLRQDRPHPRPADGLRGARPPSSSRRASSGVMLFGMERVGKGLHFFATLMVAVGTLMSAFWILSANSWMHTPAGYAINAAGQFVPVGLVGRHLQSVVSLSPRAHGAGRLSHHRLRRRRASAPSICLRDRGNEGARVMFSMAMWMAAIVAPIQVVAGDLHGLNTLEHQPAKIAAMEGHWETRLRPAADPVRLARHGRRRRRATRSRCRSSAASSSPTTGTATVKGLKAWPRSERPNSTIVFWSFRIMVGHRRADAPRRRLEPVAALPRQRLFDSTRAAAAGGADGAVGLRRRACGLDHDRGRPPALHGLRPAAHRPVASRPSTPRRSAPRSSPSSSSTSRVRRRHVLHAAADGQAARARRARHREGRADPRRRHHAGTGAGRRGS